MSVRLLFGTALLTIAAGCSGPSSPSATSSPSPSASPMSSGPAVGAAAMPGSTASVHSERVSQRLVSMDDACDSDTFDAVLGAGSCTRPGGVKFEQFISLLSEHGSVGAWHFAPPQTTVASGTTLLAINRGGETHTFTKVAAFGGGIVPQLNQLSGNPGVAPECTKLEGDDFVPPGGTYTEKADGSGTVKFQCCIHPWMRLEATVASH